jgi:hypothetical protein
VSSSKGLRGVVEHQHAGRFGDGGNGIVIGRQAEQIDRDDGLRLKAEPRGGVERGGKTLGIDVERVGVDIDEDGRGAEQRHHFGSGAEGKRRAEHRVARGNALGHQHQHERVGAAGAGNGMAGATELGERGFEGAHLGAEDELAMRQHAADRFVDRRPQASALGRHVDERNRRQLGVLVHRTAKTVAISRQPCAASAARRQE